METGQKEGQILQLRTEHRRQRVPVFGVEERLHRLDQLRPATQVFVTLPLLLGKVTARLVFSHQGVGLLPEGLQDVRQLLDHLTNGGTGSDPFHSFFLGENEHG